MKKIANTFCILMLFIVMFSINSYAVVLDAVDVKLDKTTVHPGENVTVSINFGENLGAYTASVSYDNSLFEYVSSDGGTANDTTDKIKVVYFDQIGGENPRNSMSVTFKAKDGITTSNPTEFTVTLEGMANNNASITFDDITIPIVKNVVVEPEYRDYILKLEYTDGIIENQEKDMKISYSSAMGRHYAKARLVAEAETPEGAKVQLIGIDSAGLKHDIIQSGWGEAQGYEIGGTNYAQVLNVKGLFTKSGKYKITLKLIDRENSDTIINQNSFDISVGQITINPITPTAPADTVGQVTNKTTQENKIVNTTNNTNTVPAKLPKTGINIYIPIASGLIILIGAFIINNRKNKKDIF